MSKELRIGLIALVAGGLLYYGFNYLKGINVFSNTNRYFVEYDNTDGLTIGSAIKINGVQVGRVSSVLFQPETSDVLVELNLQGNIELGDATIAELAADGFLGSKAIILNRKTDKGLLTSGDYLIPTVDKGLSEILEQAQPITDNIQVTLRRVNEILLGMEGFGEELKSMVENLDKVLVNVNGVLEENDGKIAGTFSKVDSLVTNLNAAVVPMNQIMRNFESLSDSLKNSELKATIATTNSLLININSTLDSLTNAKGSIGKLISNDSLYQNLNKTVVDLDKLLIHFNQYPRDFMKPLGRKHNKLEGLKVENE